MVDKLDFTFELSPLPAEKDVSLAEAMQFLRYGGVPRIRYTGTIPAEQIEKGHLTIGRDGHYLLFVHGRDQALFGPTRNALEKAQSLMLAAHDLPSQPDAYEALLQQKLNEAARSEKLRLRGLQVDEPLCLAPSPSRPKQAPSPIDVEYFHIDRCFDDEYGRIHYVDPTDSEAMEEDLIASLVGDPMYSYSNVTLEREGLLALAAELSPDLISHNYNPARNESTEPTCEEDPSNSTRPRGRPSSMPLIEEELRRRAATGQIQKSVKKEAEYLSKWLADTHPGSPQMRPKSVSDKICGAGGLHALLSRPVR